MYRLNLAHTNRRRNHLHQIVLRSPSRRSHSASQPSQPKVEPHISQQNWYRRAVSTPKRPSIRRDVNETTGTKPLLPPTPPLRSYLLPDKQEPSESDLLYELSKRLTAPKDVEKIAELMRKLSRRPRIPASSNALLARMLALEEKLPRRAIISAMHDATRHPAALHQLLMLDKEQMESQGFFVRGIRNKHRLWLFDHISKTFTAVPSHVKDNWSQERIRKQWVYVITGHAYTPGGFNQPPSEREHSIYHFGPAIDHTTWPDYVEMLSRIQLSGVVEREWRAFLSGKTEMQGTIVKEYLNPTIRATIRSGDVKGAWKIAHETENLVKDLEKDTLSLLLAHPEYLISWDPEMNEAALSMLEREIEKLEASFGVRWEGGEDGYHRIEEMYLTSD